MLSGSLSAYVMIVPMDDVGEMCASDRYAWNTRRAALGRSATVESARWGHPDISVSGESVEAIQSSPGSHRAVRARTKYVRRFGDARGRASAHEASDGLLRS